MAPSTKLNLKDRLEDGKLDLSMSELQDVPVKEIALLKKATYLDLSNNRLTSLGKNFTSLTHIIKLDLSSNLLTELPASFGEMKQLKHLDLYNNQLKHLPLSLGELKSLKWLDLKNNPLIPALAQVAGQCLDAQQCQQCAKKVVAFMFDMQAKVDEERNRRANQRQKDIDARDAAAAANTKSQQKKNKKAPKVENQNQKVEKQETVIKQNKQTNVQTKPKTTKKQTKNTEQIKQKQNKSSFISAFFKFVFFSFLLAALVMSIFYFKFPSEYDSFKKQSLQVWNQTLDKLPPSVATTINDVLIYVEPAVDFVHSKTNLAVAKLIEVKHLICESEQFKIVQEKVISLWKVFIVKIQDLFRTLYPEK